MNIKVERDYIYRILDKVKLGEFSIPEFQRDFIWNIQRIIELFDSIIKGYPIGSLILWKPKESQFHELNSIGGVTIEKSNNTDKLYVLDGRQRLTALLGSLSLKGDYYNKICINLEDMQILNIPSGKKSKPHILSLGVAFDSYNLVEYIDSIRQSKLSEEKKLYLIDKAKQVNRILMSYEIGYINVIGGGINDAVEVFSRLNSKTTKISSDYMLQALAYDLNSNFLFANEITKIKNNLAKYNFDNIDRILILRCVYNYLNIPFIDGNEEMILNHKELLPQITQNIAVDIEMAVNFLFKHCGLIDYRMLPYTYQLIMLALFFKNNRSPKPSQIKELVKWFFYTTYSGYFTNTSLSIVRKDIRKFNNYSLGIDQAPIKYEKLKLNQNLPSKLYLGAVRTCGMAAISILKEEGNKNNNSFLVVYVLPNTGEKKWGNTFFLASKSESEDIISYLNSSQIWDNKYSKYALSEYLVHIYREGKIDLFIEQRQKLMLQFEKEYIQSILSQQNIEVTNVLENI